MAEANSVRAAETPPAAPYLCVESVHKSFGGVHALQGIDLEVRRGEVMALVGDNGAGKSTLMKIIAGVHPLDSGRILLDGTEVSISTPHEATNLGIQTVFQDLALCENLDVAANLFLGHEPVSNSWTRWIPYPLRPLRGLDMEEQAQQAVARLNVRTLNSVRGKVGQLSGGQRQAIAIARAIRTKSTVILLDEPTAALGVAQTAQVLDMVRRLREDGHALIYITHNLRDVFDISDRITVMRHGKRVGVWRTKDTTPDEIVAAITSGIAAGSNDDG